MSGTGDKAVGGKDKCSQKAFVRLSLRFLRVSRNILLFLIRYAAEMTKLTAWDSTVAQAEPLGPILKPATNKRSRNTLRVPDMVTNIRGLLESSVPFRTELMALYSNTKKFPSMQICI